jgi:uncharacterized protein (DUF2141 family)
MIAFRLILGSLFASSLASAQAATLTVRVTEVRETQGHLLLSLNDSAAAWDGHAQALQRGRKAATGNEAVFEFRDLPPGRYAVQVMHDENDNGKLDTNFMGMPVEGYGFSRNPRSLRKATFEEAQFELTGEDQAIEVQLR